MDDLERVRGQIEELDNRIGQICDRKRYFEERENELNRDRILTEELLGEREWVLQTWGIDGCFQLTARESDFPELVRALDPQKNGYHFRIQLNDGVTLGYNDGELSIHFDNYSSPAIMNFIQDYNISVDMKSVTKLLKEIQERVVTIKRIHDRFKNLEEH